jgi:hypothetical protein
MSTGTAQYANLNNTSILWNSLQEIHDSIQLAQLEIREEQRYLTIGDQKLPVAKVVNEIHARRPCLLSASDSHLKLYFDTTKKFKDILQQPAENSIFKKVADCFWRCYGPIQLCWCTTGCRENVIVADSELGLEGVRAWKEWTAENAAL